MKESKDLRRFSREIRALTCEMFIKRKDGHIGGAFSIVEAIATIFGKYKQKEDYFVLSKGHAGPSYYAALCLLGYIPKEHICTLNENGTILPSHPDRTRTPGVECTTGSLGQGISEACGMAYGLKIQGKKGNVYCIVGDGECNEGQVFEALQFAVNKELDNLIIIIDDNKKQVDGVTSDISCDFKFKNLLEDFGFYTQEINGNNIDEVDKAIENCLKQKGQGNAIVMNTIKGCGIKYFEDLSSCHHMNFTEEQLAELQKFVDETRKELE